MNTNRLSSYQFKWFSGFPDFGRDVLAGMVFQRRRRVMSHHVVEHDLLSAFEAGIAALERLGGRQALELEFLKGAMKQG